MITSGDDVAPPTASVSVIVPTSGDRRFLAEALWSLIDQTYSDWECIVVLDGPRLEVELPDDDRIRVVAHALHRQGPGAARNTGMAAARGRFLAFLDDDDRLTPTRLQAAVDGIGERSVHLCGLAQFEGEEEATTRISENRDDPRAQAHVGQALIRRDQAVQFTPWLRVGEDVEWWMRMADRRPFASAGAVGYLLRMHSGERVGVDADVRVACRRAILGMHRDTLDADRPARAHHQARLASAALLAGRNGLASYWASRALLTRPARLPAKILARALVGWLPNRVGTSDDAHGG